MRSCSLDSGFWERACILRLCILRFCHPRQSWNGAQFGFGTYEMAHSQGDILEVSLSIDLNFTNQARCFLRNLFSVVSHVDFRKRVFNQSKEEYHGSTGAPHAREERPHHELTLFGSWQCPPGQLRRSSSCSARVACHCYAARTCLRTGCRADGQRQGLHS